MVALCAGFEGILLILRGMLPLVALGLLIGVAGARLLGAALPNRDQRQVVATLLFTATALVSFASPLASASPTFHLLTLSVATAAFILLFEGRGPDMKRRAAKWLHVDHGFRSRPVMGDEPV